MLGLFEKSIPKNTGAFSEIQLFNHMTHDAYLITMLLLSVQTDLEIWRGKISHCVKRKKKEKKKDLFGISLD